jgi:hypothetical protein
MVLKEEREMRQTRAYSKETRKAFAAGLERLIQGSALVCIAGGSGEVTHKFFWLAEALPESKQSNRVVFKADSADPNWDIKRGADVLDVQWLERVDADAHPLRFEPGAVQTIALPSVLPKKVAEFERTTTNRRYLKWVYAKPIRFPIRANTPVRSFGSASGLIGKTLAKRCFYSL